MQANSAVFRQPAANSTIFLVHSVGNISVFETIRSIIKVRWTHKDKDKTHKDKDLQLVLQESLRTSIDITVSSYGWVTVIVLY